MDEYVSFVNKIHNPKYDGLPKHYPSLVLWRNADFKVHSMMFNLLKHIDGSLKTGLYVNIPFCKRKCRFCFLDIITEQKYLDIYPEILTQEFKFYSKVIKHIPIDTVYIGGGTPNLLSRDSLEMLLKGLHSEFNLLKIRQISVESNVDLWDEEKIKVLKDYGVNLVIIGIQTFNSDVLKMHNRIQNIKGIYRLFDTLRKNNINIGVDILIGIYNSVDTKIFYNDIKKLISLKPQQIHINRYKPVYGRLSKNHKQLLISLQNHGFEILTANGYERIDEDSCVLKPYSDLKRNIQGDPKYHMFSNIVALGVGSMGHIYGKVRYRNVTSFEEYKNKVQNSLFPIGKYILIGEKDEIINYALNNICQDNGIDLKEMFLRFSKRSCVYVLKKLKKMEKEGVVYFSNNKVFAYFPVDWYAITMGLYDERYIRKGIKTC